MTRYYLGPRHARREEMLGHKADLERLGHTVHGRWLTEPYPATEVQILIDHVLGGELANDDLRDICKADTFVAFTELPGVEPNRGGRHVEFGIAIAREMTLAVVGPRENVFHCLPGVKVYANWAEYLAEVAGG